MASDDFKNKDVNFKLEKKVGGQMEESVLARAVAIKNRRKPCGYKKETFEKRVNNVKANGSYTVPRLQEPSSEKLGTAGLARKMTLGTTKDKMIAPKSAVKPSALEDDASKYAVGYGDHDFYALGKTPSTSAPSTMTPSSMAQWPAT